ncbi:hypothetical protein PR048_024084 [Dryococelus australis]|uniref:Uncharacterized protein n=1 Tax=Dryococelus australis TaxID=614101 RepID=A0ABQ9GVW8_9NEOP|nr:hypothetical protein PR048_024084 [Dryococelus australis]
MPNIKPVNKTVQLVTCQHTREIKGEASITIRICDIETVTVAFVSDEMREEAILGTPWLT